MPPSSPHPPPSIPPPPSWHVLQHALGGEKLCICAHSPASSARCTSCRQVWRCMRVALLPIGPARVASDWI